MKRFPFLLLTLVFIFLFSDFFFRGKLPLPADTLIGSYFPWLDYRWGFPTGVPVKNPLTSDAFSQFFVWKKVTLDLFRQGQFPLWNPYSFAGTPLLATFHSSVLNPANLLLFLPQIGWGFYIFFALLAAALSIYLYLGLWTKNTLARLSGALIYALAGPMTTWAEFGTATWAAAFFPLVFYFLHQLFPIPKPRHLAGLAVSFTLLIFAGHVQLLTYTFLLIPFYLLFLARLPAVAGQQKRFPAASLTAAAFVLLAGLGLAAIQLLPSLAFFSRSIRAEENYAATFNFGLSPWTEAIRLWAADFFGSPVTRNHFSPVSYHEYSSFLGALSLSFVIALLFSAPLRRQARFPLALFFGSLFLAFDHPLSRAVFSLPLPLFTYSSASRLFFLTNFSAAILVALSLAHLTAKTLSRSRLLVIALSAVSLTAVYFVPPEHRLVNLRNLIPYLAVYAIFIFFSFLLRHRHRLLLFGVFLLFALDLGRYFLKYNTFFPAHLVFPSTPVLEFLQKQPPPFRLVRQKTNLLTPNNWAYYGLESVEGYDPLYSSDYAHFFHLIKADPYTNGVSRYAELEDVNHKFLDALNVKYFLALDPRRVEDKPIYDKKKPSVLKQLTAVGWYPVFRDGTVIIYQNPNFLPRAYFADEVLVALDTASLVNLIDSPRFDPRRQAVVLDELTLDPPSPLPSRVEIVSYASQRTELSIQTPAKRLLVFVTNYDPGWQVEIDGQSSKIRKVNGALQGVIVPAGEHQVIFSYRPFEFRLGLLVSFLSAFILVLTLATYNRLKGL